MGQELGSDIPYRAIVHRKIIIPTHRFATIYSNIMTRKPYIKSSICALQNKGGYGCRAVIDNPLNRIYRALSWLLAAASAFVCSAIGSALGVTAE